MKIKELKNIYELPIKMFRWGVKIEEITKYSNNAEVMKYYVFDDEIVAFI